MKYRLLGNTDLEVSLLSLGTVELGLEYGIYAASEPRKPTTEQAVGLLLKAYDSGINFVDTAPGYGCSEELVGKSLRQWRGEAIHVATKVAQPDISLSSQAIKNQVLTSIENSLTTLGLNCLDIVKVHNLSEEHILRGDLIEVLQSAKNQGKVRYIGATTYDVKETEAAILTGQFSVLQTPYNLLDQRMTASVFPLAVERGVALVGRSAFLKGALTARYVNLPDSLAELRGAAKQTQQKAADLGMAVEELALRFCLSQKSLSSVLVGVRNQAELQQALDWLAQPELGNNLFQELQSLAVNDCAVIDPRRWGIP